MYHIVCRPLVTDLVSELVNACVQSTFAYLTRFSRYSQKYRITKRVGGGSFGDIYLGVGANGEKVSR
jgi:hypothetical protein